MNRIMSPERLRLTPYPRPRAHHDDNADYITENELALIGVRDGGRIEMRFGAHIHRTNLTLPQAREEILRIGINRSVAQLRSCMSPKDVGDGDGCFVIFEKLGGWDW